MFVNSQESLAIFKGPTSKEREEKGGVWEWKERGRKGKGRKDVEGGI